MRLLHCVRNDNKGGLKLGFGITYYLLAADRVSQRIGCIGSRTIVDRLTPQYQLNFGERNHER